MPTPLLSDYVAAMQNADINFSSLLPIVPVSDGNNLKFVSGDFAIVFKMYKSDVSKNYAIKCFTRDEPLRAQRYADIHSYLQNNLLPFL